MDLDDLVTPPVRLRLRGAIDDATEKLAMRAAFAAAHLFGVAAGILLRRLRAMNDPLATAVAQAKEAELKAALLVRARDRHDRRIARTRHAPLLRAAGAVHVHVPETQSAVTRAEAERKRTLAPSHLPRDVPVRCLLVEVEETPMAQVVVVRGHMVDDRTIELEQPVDRSAPVAELRVKLQPATTRKPGLVEFLESLPPGTRSKADIDAELEAERDSWG